LVGVVWADSSVHFPVYNAHEVALQQIIQVAGRAGRSRHDGRVIIQSFDNHPLFSFIDELKYPAFCVQELAARREFGYPPFQRLVTIEVAGDSEEQVVADALLLKERIERLVSPEIQLLGPARPMREKVHGVFYRHILCKSASYAPLHTALTADQWRDLKSTVYVHLS
jgi:primosomal protein N' (replication factor Y)